MRIKVPERSTLEPGIHRARLESVVEATSERGPYLRWMFSVKYDGETIRRAAHSSLSFGERSKAHGWLQALIGRQLKPGETIE
jgi:hypothetical protein